MTNEQNKIAKKFKAVVSALKILGYGAAILCAIAGFLYFFTSIESSITNLISAITVAVGTWMACLFYEAIAEGLQLLQDIKNK